MRPLVIALIALSLSGSHIFAADKRPEYLKKLSEFPSFVISPDGKTLVRGGDGIAHVYDCKTLKRKYSIRVNRVIMDKRGIRQFSGGPISIAFSPDRKTIALLNLFAEVQLHDLATGKRTGAILFPPKIEALLGLPGPGANGIRYSPDGKSVALVVTGLCALFETKTGKHRKTIRGVQAVTATNEGRFLGLHADSSKLKTKPPQIVDLDSGKTVRKLELKKPLKFERAVFSRDGRFVVLAGWPRLVVWDTKTGKQKLAFEGRAKEVFERGIAFSPKGRYLAAVSVDQTNGIVFRLRGWRLSDGKVVLKHESFARVPLLFGATPDGKAMMYRFGKRGPLELFRFPTDKSKSN